MNKRYASLLALAMIGCAAMAQSNERQVRMPYSSARHGQASIPAADPDRAVIFQDDFDTDTNWTLTVDPSGFQGVQWQIGEGLESGGPYATPAIESTTAENGYAMLCSDCGGNNGDTYEKCSMTTSHPIDMTNFNNVLLEFQTQYRRFSNEQTYISVSTDGINWPEPPSDTATVGLPAGLFPVWADGELETSVSPGNPTIRRFNLSCVAGGEPQVWVRFYWYGIYGYAWYVDDVVISETSQFDLALFSTYLGHTGTGDEFGRIPENQLGTIMNVGGQVANIGASEQTNVSVVVNVVDAGGNPAFSHTTAPINLAADSCGVTTSFVEEPTTIPALTPGLYTATYSLTSDQIGSDANLTNNILVRVFEVTTATGIYSLDGLGVYPDSSQLLSGTGTNSFTDNPSGVFCMTNYYIQEPTMVYGLWVGITSNSSVDGLIVASLHDTANVKRPNADVSQPFVTSADYFLTQADIDANHVVIPFTQPYEMTPDILYLAGVELISADTSIKVRVQDDLTIREPAWSSLIWLPVDDANNFTYSNGNAFIIRLLLDPSIGMQEREELEGVNVFPNPTSGLVNLIFTVQGSYTVELINALGETVSTQRLNGNSTLDLSDLAKGVYSVRISNKEKTTVQRISLN